MFEVGHGGSAGVDARPGKKESCLITKSKGRTLEHPTLKKGNSDVFILLDSIPKIKTFHARV